MRITATVLLAMLAYPCLPQTFEAENGVLAGTTMSTQRTGYAGVGYVTGFDADGDKVTLSLTTNAGVYNLYIRYASPSGDKFNYIYVNGQNVGNAAFPQSTVFAETKVGKIYLDAGENEIAIVKDWGYFDVDNIRLEPSQPSDIYNIAEQLVTSAPSQRTDSLYDFLSAIYGKVILSGQCGGATEFNRIKNVSGKTPVIRGFDLMDYSPSRVAHGANSTEVEKSIAWDDEGGIVTFCWHWNAPKDLIDQPGKEWWRGFYTEATTFDISKAMNDPQSEEHELIVNDIDAIAVQLKKLQDANVPVIWRPLHEAEGRWFWWGAKGPEACRWLWHLLYDRLAHHHEINNLIWTWTTTDKPSALDWYPGHDYVDMIGADIYLPAGTRSSSFITFDNIVSLYEGKKIIALTENGPIPDAEESFIEGAAWSWFATWSGNFITDGVSNNAEHINTVYNHYYVITLDEIHNVTTIMAELDEKRKEIKKDSVVVNIGDNVRPVIIYHNPITNDQLRLRLKNVGSSSRIAIFNVQAQVVLSQEYSQSDEQEYLFDFGDQKAGVYLVKIITPQFTKVIRVVKD